MAVTVAEYVCAGCLFVCTTEEAAGGHFLGWCGRCKRDTDWTRKEPLLDLCTRLGINRKYLEFYRYLVAVGRLTPGED